MAKKTNDIKNYLASIGKTEQLHVFVGYTNDEVENSSDDSSLKIWQNMIFSQKVSRGDVIGVIPNITWTYGNVYVPWKSGIVNSGAYYAWNRQNGNVYLCLSNNSNNRDDLSGKNASTYIPNHAYGIQNYPDGYSWLPIYRITSEYLRFVKNNWIPVISFEDFEIYTEATEYQNNSNFCGVSSLDTVGNCVLYAKDNIRLAKTTNTFDNYTKGSQVSALSTTCQMCYNLFKDNSFYSPVFYTSASYPSTITIESKLELVGRLIRENKLPASSAFYALYDIIANSLSDGAIISASIDLSSFDSNDLIVTVENPEISVSSYTGTGSRIRFKTYKSIDGKNVIQGVDVFSNGSGYKDIILDISSSIFQNPAIKDLILASITINYDVIDGLGVDPYDVLNCTNIQVDARIDINSLKSSNLVPVDTINMYSLVSNPLEKSSNGDFIVSGSDSSKYTTKLNYGYSILVVTHEGDVGLVTEIPQTGSIQARGSSNEPISNPNLLTNSIPAYPLLPNQSVVIVNNLDYSNTSKIKSFLDGNNNNFIVDSIPTTPNFKQYSGKILQTVKTNKNLKLTRSSGEVSKILRINIIKGI